MKTIIGVMGPGEKEATAKDRELAEQVGALVAKHNCVLLCGGMSGTMQASAKGAQEAGGVTIGIGPTRDKRDMNKYLDIPLLTGMHAGRNYMNVISSDILLFVSIGSPGTLSELAFAIQTGTPCIIINASKKCEAYITDIADTSVTFVDTVEDMETRLQELLQN